METTDELECPHCGFADCEHAGDEWRNRIARLRAENADLRDACTQKQEIINAHTATYAAFQERIAELEARIAWYRANRYGNTPTPDDDPAFVAALSGRG